MRSNEEIKNAIEAVEYAKTLETSINHPDQQIVNAATMDALKWAIGEKTLSNQAFQSYINVYNVKHGLPTYTESDFDYL